VGLVQQPASPAAEVDVKPVDIGELIARINEAGAQ